MRGKEKAIEFKRRFHKKRNIFIALFGLLMVTLPSFTYPRLYSASHPRQFHTQFLEEYS